MYHDSDNDNETDAQLPRAEELMKLLFISLDVANTLRMVTMILAATVGFLATAIALMLVMYLERG